MSCLQGLPISLTSLERSISAVHESLSGPRVSHEDWTVYKSSSPSLEVCDPQTAGGVQTHAAVPHHAAQQGPQLRGDPVQGHLRGHVVHLTRSESACGDTATLYRNTKKTVFVLQTQRTCVTSRRCHFYVTSWCRGKFRTYVTVNFLMYNCATYSEEIC